MSDKLTGAEMVQRAAQIDAMLDAINDTAPGAVQAMGGRDALARCSEMTCIGPVPCPDADEWERMSQCGDGVSTGVVARRGGHSPSVHSRPSCSRM